jgi:ADP-heptose:LPS heptosyltransferase
VRILAIRFARLGDVILLLPALESLKKSIPNSEITLLTGHRCAPIAELCPAIDHVVGVDRLAMRDGPVLRTLRDMTSLVQEIRRRRFDIVVDFHSFRETNLLAWVSRAQIRLGMKRHNAPYWAFCFNTEPVLEDKRLHVKEMFQKVVGGLVEAAVGRLGAPISLPESAKGRGWLIPKGSFIPERATLALYVDAPVPERIWPPERFAEVADFAIEKLGAAVVVISSSSGKGLALRVQKASRNADRLSVLTDLTISELADVVSSAQLLISNDTGPMHIGPAVGVRTLGLFSVGLPEHFRPIGPVDRYLRENPIERLDVKDVIKAAGEMWATAYRDLRR